MAGLQRTGIGFQHAGGMNSKSSARRFAPIAGPESGGIRVPFPLCMITNDVTRFGRN